MSDVAQQTDILARATAEYDAGRFEEAAGILEEIADRSAFNPALLELKGAIELAQGNALEAVASLEQSVAVAQESLGVELPSLYVSLATASEKAGLVEKAIDATFAARRLTEERWRGVRSSVVRSVCTPELARLDSQLARMLWESGRHDASISAMARLIDESPDPGTSLEHATQMLAWRMRLIEGLVVCLHRHALRPLDGAIARNTGQFLEHLGSSAGASAWYRLAVECDKADLVSADGLSRCEAAHLEGDWDGPIAELIRAAKSMAAVNTSPAELVATATFLLSQFETPAGAGKEDWPLFARGAAIALLRRALAVEPDQPEMARRLAEALIAKGDAAEAEGILRGAIKRSPLDADMHRLVGNLEMANGDDEAAVRSYRAALGLRPVDVSLMTRLAAALAYRDPTQEAVDLLGRASVLDPLSADVKGLLGVSLCRLQRLDEGLGWLYQAVELQPNNATWHFGIACALLLQGKYDEAWPEYAWRWVLPELRATERRPKAPLEPIDTSHWRDRTVLFFAEQGQGDTLHMLRYVRKAAELCGRVSRGSASPKDVGRDNSWRPFRFLAGRCHSAL